MESSNLKSFQYIVTFVEDLSSEYGTKQHSLALYNRLLGKTRITHHDSIRKHIGSFKTFVEKNRDAILSKDLSLMVENRVQYSDKVYIDFSEIFKLADNDNKDVILKHLLVITNSIDPASGAIEVLKKTMTENSNEGNFLSTIVEKLEQNVDPNTKDPMSAIMGLMQNGVFTELVSSMNAGMQNGSLDMGKLLGTVQGMMSSMTAQKE